MLTLLSGENDYELTQKLAHLKSAFGNGAERYAAAELNREQLANIFAGQTLFAKERLVILDNPSANSELWTSLATWASRLSDETQLVLVEPKLDKRTSAYKWLKQHAEMHEFSLYDERDTRGITNWVKHYVAKHSVELSDQQMSRLIKRAGHRQWTLAQAIDKLALVPELTDQWIDDVVDQRPDENVFMLFETVLTSDQRRLEVMVEHLKLTEDPFRLLGLMTSQALQLAALTYGDANASRLAADTGAKSAYPYQKLAPYAARLSKTQTKELLELLAASDHRLKSSDATPWLVLERTLAGMASIVSR